MIGFVDILMLLLTLFVVLLAVTSSRKPGAEATRVRPPVPAQRQVQPAAARRTPRPAPVARKAVTPPPKSAGVVAAQHRNAATRTTPPQPSARPARKPGAAPRRAAAAPAPTPESAPAAARAAAARAHAAPPPQAVLRVPEDLQREVQVTRSASAVNLVIKGDVLFATGSAELRPAGKTLLDRVARLFADNDYPISVEGHTDDTPIHTTRFPSNWELSTARATNVTRFLIGEGIAPDRLSAVGYADTRPRAANSDAAGRAANRRVSLVVHIKRTSSATPIARRPH